MARTSKRDARGRFVGTVGSKRTDAQRKSRSGKRPDPHFTGTESDTTLGRRTHWEFIAVLPLNASDRKTIVARVRIVLHYKTRVQWYYISLLIEIEGKLYSVGFLDDEDDEDDSEGVIVTYKWLSTVAKTNKKEWPRVLDILLERIEALRDERAARILAVKVDFYARRPAVIS